MSPVKSPEQNSVLGVRKTYKIVVENDEAEELPPGWKKEMKTRKKGSATKVDWYYTDPVTGYIFRSLKDVKRYLKTGDLGRLAIKPKNNEERLHMKEREERNELREQMSETLRSKRPLDKTESEFSETDCRCTPGVCEMSPVKSPEQSSARDVGKTYKIVVEKDEVDELPPGWTKEVKTRKTGSTTKVDRRYTDPVTGYIFHSLKDVQRYLKTGKLGRLATKPKNNEDEILHTEEREERSESKEQMRETLRRKRPVDNTGNKFSETGESDLLHRASKRLAAPSPSPSPPLPEPKTRQAARLAGVVVDTQPPTLSPIEYKIRQATHLTEVAVVAPSLAPPELKTHQPTQLAEVTVDASPSRVEPKTRNATRKAGILIDSLPPSPPDTRTSRLATHQAGIKIDLQPSSSRDSKTRQATPQVGIKFVTSPSSQPEPKKMIENHNENADMDNKTNHNQETSVIIPPVNQESYEYCKKYKETEKQELPVVNPTVSSPIPQHGYGYGGNMKSDSSINFSMKKLWTDPCIEFAVKTLTGAIPCGDLNKPENPSPSPLKVPLEELWTDPCIEFAVKTLTGVIPVGENDNLQHRPATSRNTWAPHDFNQPDVGMGFYQTDVSKHFETEQNKQLQDSTNVNGQYSRSRFF